MFSKSSAIYCSKGDYLVGDSLTESSPIFLDVPNGQNELIMAAYSPQSILKFMYPIVGFCKELLGIVLPPSISLDLPKINLCRKQAQEHVAIAFTGPGAASGSIQKQQTMGSVNQLQQQTPLSQSMHFSDPVSIISRAAEFLTAGDYGMMSKVLVIMYRHQKIMIWQKYSDKVWSTTRIYIIEQLNLVLMHYLRNR